MDPVEILKIAGVLMLGSLVQSSSGIGFGLFGVPLLLVMGFNLPSTVVIIVIGSAIQKITAIRYLWKAADWGGQAPFMTISLLGLPLGIYMMYEVSFMSDDLMKQVIGAIVLLLLILQQIKVIKQREHVAVKWGYIAGFFSGLLNGLANIGGPPLVLWMLAHKWDNEKMRVTPIAFSILLVPFQLILMMTMFGAQLWPPLLKALLLTPVVFLGSRIGLKIGDNISTAHLRNYIKILLLIIALSSILKPLL